MKEDHKCDLIIALTHMRLPNDEILAEEVPEIDLILGGHDHMTISEMNKNTGVFTVKSGTDFEEFSDMLLYFDVKSKSEARLLKGMRIKNFKKTYDSGKYFYSPEKKMMMFCGKVNITKRFEPH